MSKYLPCPCGSKHLYHKCCNIYHDGELPETAVLLMRSRYAAYALGLPDYIMDTTHPDNPSFSEDKKKWRLEIFDFCAATRFIGLHVLEFDDGTDRAIVIFRADLMHNAEDVSFTEKSTFEKKDGRWLYLSGETA